MAKYREEIKLEAVQRYLSGNESLRTIGEDIGVFHRTLLTWVK